MTKHPTLFDLEEAASGALSEEEMAAFLERWGPDVAKRIEMLQAQNAAFLADYPVTSLRPTRVPIPPKKMRSFMSVLHHPAMKVSYALAIALCVVLWGVFSLQRSVSPGPAGPRESEAVPGEHAKSQEEPVKLAWEPKRWLKECRQGRYERCAKHITRALEKDSFSKKDPALALKLQQVSCDAGGEVGNTPIHRLRIKACHQAGSTLLKKIPAHAPWRELEVPELVFACHQGYGMSCQVLGFTLREEPTALGTIPTLSTPSTGERMKAAIGYFKDGCAAGEGDSCCEVRRHLLNAGFTAVVDDLQKEGEALRVKALEAGVTCPD